MGHVLADPPFQRDLVVDVLAVGSVRPARMIGVRGHHADAGTVELMARDGVVLSSPGDTFRMLAPLLSLNELVEAGDSLVRRNCPLMTMEEVDRYVRRHARRRGAKRLKLAAELVRPGCDSPRETRVRLILSAFGLPEPEINLVVSRPGERVRYGDMVYPQWKVIVEYDGQHHTAGPQYAADIERLEQLARAGWTVVRILREHLANPASVAARVSTALRDNGWRP